MKIRSIVYKDIKKELKEQLPNLQFIDLQKGQFARMDENYPIPLPAALIEFKPVAWTNTADGQLGDTVISIYLYLDYVTDSFDTAETENETIGILDNLDELYEKMQGFSGDNFNPLVRITDTVIENRLGFIVFRTDFKTTLFHANPNKQYDTAPKPDPKFKF